MKKALHVLFTLGASLFAGANISMAQSDDCDTATPLTIAASGNCGGVAGDNGSATDSFNYPSCDATTNGFQDVWYTFTTWAGMNSVTVTLTPGTMTDWGFEVRDGCFGAPIACEVGPMGGVAVSVAPGTQYWLQIFSNNDWGIGGSFTICVEGSGTPPPANDDPANAAPLTYGTSCVPITGNVTGATLTSIDELCSGNAGNPDDDVWFSVPVTGCKLGITVDGAAQFDAVVQVWAYSLGTYYVQECYNATGDGGVENVVFSPVSPYSGETYYIQVYDYGTGSVSTPTFTICAFNPRPNDLCSGAITLPMSAACNFTAGESANACGDYYSCNGAPAGDGDDGVWYSFVAISSEVRVVVDGNGNSTTGYDPVVLLRSTNGCVTTPPQTQLACADATGPGGTETVEFSGIIPGVTYHILVYDNGEGVPGTTSFNICVQDLSTAGIGDIGDPASSWRLDPNPATGTVMLSGMSGANDVEVMDMTGRALLRKHITSDRLTFDVSAWIKGCYLVTVRGRNGPRVRRLVVE